MIRSLRRKFILCAMAAFGILLLILVSGIVIVSYIRIENRTDRLMQQLFSMDPPSETNYAAPRKRQDIDPIAYYDVSIDADGEIIDISEKGIWEPDFDAAERLAEQILRSGKDEGKHSGFSYRLMQSENTTRIILMDNSLQLHTLKDILQTAFFLCAFCLLLLFLILLPISAKVVRSYAQYIEKQKQFITNAGHDIKTPVAILLSNVDAMELIQGENKWSRNIRSQTDRLNLLLQRLLFMMRLDESSVLPSIETLEIHSLLSAELETYEPIIAERNLKVHSKLRQELSMKGNRMYMQQLIHMLMDNAVQYTNIGGEISVSMELKRRKLRLIFANTVAILPDCPPDALFDRFYRGDSARTQANGGCGVGLSAARAIAEMHRGTISAEYEAENRIRFIVELPLK